MPHYEARVSSKGQITIPSEVREFFSLKEGDRLDFYIDPRGGRAARLLARNAKFSDLIGLLGHTGSRGPLTQEDVDNAIGEHLKEKHERISREWNEWREFQDWKKARAAE